LEGGHLRENHGVTFLHNSRAPSAPSESGRFPNGPNCHELHKQPPPSLSLHSSPFITRAEPTTYPHLLTLLSTPHQPLAMISIASPNRARPVASCRRAIARFFKKVAKAPTKVSCPLLLVTGRLWPGPPRQPPCCPREGKKLLAPHPPALNLPAGYEKPHVLLQQTCSSRRLHPSDPLAPGHSSTRARARAPACS
jgi:hypothetical protein